MKKEYTNDKGNNILTQEQRKEEIRKFTLLSDAFLSVALKDVSACEYVLRILTGNMDLHIKAVQTQYTISKIQSRSARLDVFAEAVDGALYNLEIQRRNTVDHPRRLRFYGAMVDSESLEKGKDYEQLPEVYLFYICEKDFHKDGKTVYPVEKYLGEKEISYVDGMHVIYVNTEVDDGTEIAKLMQYFKTADPEDMSHGVLSQRVRLLKCEEGGYLEMCEVTDRFIQYGWEYGRKEGQKVGLEEGQKKGRKEGRRESQKETARNLASMGMTLAFIAKAIGEREKVISQWLEEATVTE